MLNKTGKKDLHGICYVSLDTSYTDDSTAQVNQGYHHFKVTGKGVPALN